jgi:predicted NBD/HSP70 family sugar kinase
MESKRYLCLDFGGSGIKYGIFRAENPETLFQQETRGVCKNTFRDQAEFRAAVEALIRENLAACPDISGIAVSYCGELNDQTGRIHSPGAYPYNRNLDMKVWLEKTFLLPVSVQNDGNAAMLAEWKFGSLKGMRDAFMLVLGTGVGGSLVIDGHLHAGRNGFSGMLSVAIRSLGGEAAPENMIMSACGSGYLAETYMAQCVALGIPVPDQGAFQGWEFFEKANAGDELALQVLRQYCRQVTHLIINLHQTLELEGIAIGGGISAQPLLIEEIQRQVHGSFQSAPMRILQIPEPAVTACHFHNDANLIGALIHHFACFAEKRVQ